jgi:hypothetical protein
MALRLLYLILIRLVGWLVLLDSYELRNGRAAA